MSDSAPTIPVFELPIDFAKGGGVLIRFVPLAPIEQPPPIPVYLWPKGKGYFIWNLGRCAGGIPARLAALAKSAGLDWVTIKISEAGGEFGGDIRPWVDALREAGISVWGWGYVYGSKPELEAAMAASRTRSFGLDGFMIDAEAEYKQPGKAAAAKIYTQRLRAALPDVGIGLCSYRYPSLHRELPWAEFLAGCDFHIPQVYWIGAISVTAPGSQLARSVAELKALKNIPVVPVGVACDNPYSGGTWRPTVAQLNNFDATAKTLGLPGLSWWSWQHAEAIPDFWNAIARHGWSGA